MSVTLADVPYVIVGDTETTGLDPSLDRICSVSFHSLVRGPDDEWSRQEEVNFLINPEQPIPEVAAKVNGFTWVPDGEATENGRINLAGCPTFKQVAPTIRAFLGNACLVFHNASFDISMLDAEFRRCGLPPLEQEFICTKQSFADMKGLPREHVYIPGTNLNALCDTLGVDKSSRTAPDGTELHGAKVDTDLASECFKKLASLNEGQYLIVENTQDLPHNEHSHMTPKGPTP